MKLTAKAELSKIAENWSNQISCYALVVSVVLRVLRLRDGEASVGYRDGRISYVNRLRGKLSSHHPLVCWQGVGISLAFHRDGLNGTCRIEDDILRLVCEAWSVRKVDRIDLIHTIICKKRI